MPSLDLALAIHIGAGVVALASFGIPVFTQKGGVAHRRAGWAFVVSMGVLCLTSVPIALFQLFEQPPPRRILFLKGALFFTVLAAAPVWKGIRVLRFKGSHAGNRTLDVMVALCVIAAGIWAVAEGLKWQSAILLIFGPFALFAGARDLRYWLTPEKPRLQWLLEHMTAMLTASIVAITAFVFLGARGMGLRDPGLREFVLPALILVPVLIQQRRVYRRKFVPQHRP